MGSAFTGAFPSECGGDDPRWKELYREFGEMLFTHYGVTGPLILTASSVIQKKLAGHPLAMRINLKPALSEEQLDARILREFEKEHIELGAASPGKHK